MSARLYLSTLRAVLDFAGVDPNPARDGRVRLPRGERTVVDPPSAQDIDMILANVLPRWRLPLRVLEQTGMRVGELSGARLGRRMSRAHAFGSSGARRPRHAAR